MSARWSDWVTEKPVTNGTLELIPPRGIGISFVLRISSMDLVVGLGKEGKIRPNQRLASHFTILCLHVALIEEPVVIVVAGRGAPPARQDDMVANATSACTKNVPHTAFARAMESFFVSLRNVHRTKVG
mmetsp:Transcript_5679/g.12284  ORF Transcript_5679/g.12284 Transcript_5679/m.12284 type:complete len:129 (-) Transcript_5679:357-743(-)